MKHISILIILIVTILAISIWWQVYRFQDCKRVGHSTVYCILTIGQ